MVSAVTLIIPVLKNCEPEFKVKVLVPALAVILPELELATMLAFCVMPPPTKLIAPPVVVRLLAMVNKPAADRLMVPEVVFKVLAVASVPPLL